MFFIIEKEEDYKKYMQIRREVFVEEQGVPLEIENDEYDETAVHYMLLSDGEPCSVSRIVLMDNYRAKLGRVAVLKRFRNKGLGKVLIQNIIKDMRYKNFKSIITHSQSHVCGFYEKLGFEKSGEEFYEANIAHYRMELEL